MVTDAVFTPEEAAVVLKTSATTIRRLCAAGKLPAINIGVGTFRMWRLPCAALTERIAASAPKPSAPVTGVEIE